MNPLQNKWESRQIERLYSEIVTDNLTIVFMDQNIECGRSPRLSI